MLSEALLVAPVGLFHVHTIITLWVWKARVISYLQGRTASGAEKRVEAASDFLSFCDRLSTGY
jgi:hypothetical protein